MLKTIIFISFLFMGCTSLKQWQTDYPDNLIEERIETYLEEIFNSGIDLTPFSGNEFQKFDIIKEQEWEKILLQEQLRDREL